MKIDKRIVLRLLKHVNDRESLETNFLTWTHLCKNYNEMYGEIDKDVLWLNVKYAADIGLITANLDNSYSIDPAKRVVQIRAITPEGRKYIRDERCKPVSWLRTRIESVLLMFVAALLAALAATFLL